MPEEFLTVATPLGYFGKLPCMGDFAVRRLPSAFVHPWDRWLDKALACSRERLGDAWLDAYLAAPFWRFVLAPGICGHEGWIGVLMPSVDRVERAFPLTVARATEPGHGVFGLALGNDDWFRALEDAMLAALDPASTLDRFDRQLLAAPELVRSRHPADPSSGHLAYPAPGVDAGAWLPLLDALARDARHPLSCWVTTGSTRTAPSLNWFAGLPPADGFAALLVDHAAPTTIFSLEDISS